MLVVTEEKSQLLIIFSLKLVIRPMPTSPESLVIWGEIFLAILSGAHP
jgi:hypothetical protein